MDDLSSLAEIETLDRLISVLGGASAAAEAFDEEPATISQWKQRGGIPPRKYLRHLAILKERNIRAAQTIWTFDPPPEAA